jgi:hypothetical protein
MTVKILQLLGFDPYPTSQCKVQISKNSNSPAYDPSCILTHEEEDRSIGEAEPSTCSISKAGSGSWAMCVGTVCCLELLEQHR